MPAAQLRCAYIDRFLQHETGRFDNEAFYNLLKDRKDFLTSKTNTDAEVERQLRAAEARMHAQAEQAQAGLLTELAEMRAKLAQFQAAPTPMDV